MNNFTYEESAMLCEAGYECSFIVEVENGDVIAMKHFNRDNRFDPASVYRLDFWTISKMEKIPRFEHDEDGTLLSRRPNYLCRFIATDAEGVQTAQSFGEGWACYIKRGAEASV